MIEPLSEGMLVAPFLVAIRFGIALRLTPFLGGRPIPWLAWLALTAALVWVVVPLAPISGAAPDRAAAWIVLVGWEVLIGAIFGFSVRIAYGVLESLDALLRTGVAPHPLTPSAARGGFGPYGLYLALGTAVFLVLDGHHAVISALVASVRCLPPGSVFLFQEVVAQAGQPAVGLFATAFGWAVMLSAPLFVAGLAAELGLGLVGRFFPGAAQGTGTQTVRSLTALAVLTAFLGFVVTFVIRHLADEIGRIGLCIG